MKLLPSLFSIAIGANRYTGQSFENYGLYEFKISSEEASSVVENLDSKFQLNWLKPHEGPTYEVGQTVQFLTLPENREDIESSLEKAQVG